YSGEGAALGSLSLSISKQAAVFPYRAGLFLLALAWRPIFLRCSPLVQLPLLSAVWFLRRCLNVLKVLLGSGFGPHVCILVDSLLVNFPKKCCHFHTSFTCI